MALVTVPVNKAKYTLIADIASAVVQKRTAQLTCGASVAAVESKLNQHITAALGSVTPEITKWISDHAPLFIAAPSVDVCEYRLEIRGGVAALQVLIFRCRKNGEQLTIDVTLAHAQVQLPARTVTTERVVVRFYQTTPPGTTTAPWIPINHHERRIVQDTQARCLNAAEVSQIAAYLVEAIAC